MTPREKFLLKTKRMPNGCLEWQGFCHRGYGRTRIGGGSRRAHRAAWELFVGPIPEGSNVLHRCDNPPCVDHQHLFLGTQIANIEDRVEKGRSKGAAGERHGRARLTDDEVQALRSSTETNSEAAMRLGISYHTVWDIRRGRSWRHLGDHHAD